MKVLYLLNFAGKGGTERYVETLVRYLNGTHIEAFFAYNQDGPLVEKLKTLGVPCRRVEMRRRFDFRAARELASLCREWDIDLVHCQYLREHYTALLTKRYNSHIRVVYTHHILQSNDAVTRLSNRLLDKRQDMMLAVCTKGREQLIAKMTEQTAVEPVCRREDFGPVLLEVKDLASRDGRVKQGSLSLHSGEILGLFGLGGSGRTELLECIFGYRALSAGTVLLDGKERPGLTPEEAIRSGMVLISEDRRGKAMIGNLSVRDNILLSSIDTFSRRGVLRTKAGNGAAEEQIESLHIKLASPNQRMLELSGGNQQKAVFARALMTAPRIFLCDEPTQAVDVATRSDIHHLLRRKADEGAGVLYVSSDLKELLEVADNILVMARGRTTVCWKNRDLTARQVLACCYENQEKEAQP